MNRNYDHDKYVSKNKHLAESYDIDKKDSDLENKGFTRFQRNEEASCFNCKNKSKCSEFNKKRGGSGKGAVSVDAHQNFMCNRYLPEPTNSKQLSDRQIKSLLKNVKKGLC